MWLLLITMFLILAFGLLIFSLASLIIATLSGAPYVPAQKHRIAAAINLIQPNSEMVIVDIGSGDGRVVRAMAQNGAKVDGFEIQSLLVYWSKLISRLKNVPNTNFYRQNLFSVNLSRYDAVVMYALPQMMNRLQQKFETELKPSCKVVSISFPIPGWREAQRRDGVYLYFVKDQKLNAED